MELRGSDVLNWDKALKRGQSYLSGPNPSLGALIVCGINFGLRIGDLLRVTWEDTRGDFFVIRERKTGKPRKIIINTYAREAIEALRAQTPDYRQRGPLFKSNKGCAYSQQHVNRLLKKAFGKGVSSHGLRKTFGRELYEKTGRDLARVQLQLNHSNPKDTLRYIGITQEQMDECFSVLGG